MTNPPHSRAWYARLARELGGYRHPWTRVLDGPDPELTFDALLLDHLTRTPIESFAKTMKIRAEREGEKRIPGVELTDRSFPGLLTKQTEFV